jgi:hypothetical protein
VSAGFHPFGDNGIHASLLHASGGGNTGNHGDDFHTSLFESGDVGFGVTGTWFVMLSNKTVGPNVVVAMWMGGGFLCSQIAVSAYYNSYPSPLQYLAAGLRNQSDPL